MKKFTKILSLALALVLVLSTTAFAATTVYYVQDFSGYADLDALLDDIPHATATPTAAIAITMRNAGNNMFYRTGSAPQGGLTATAAAPALETDASGVKWFKMHTNANNAERSDYFAIAPNTTWDYSINTDETYIISYDIKVAPTGTPTADKRQNFMSMWSNDETGTTVQEEGFFDIGRFITSSSYGEGDPDKIYARSYNNKNWYSAKNHELTPNVAHNMAVGYKYSTDGEGNALTYPYKTMAVDGTVTATSSATGFNTNNVTPKLVGIKFTYGYYMGIATTNYKMYTIKNTDTLDVSRVGTGLVPTSNASVEVKFSQPVGKLDKTKVAVNGLTYGTDFTVSDVTDVATSTEVYSKATVNFTKELAGDTTYTITFGDVTNEIGTAITGNTVSFTTMKAPTFDLEIAGSEGLEAGTAIAANAMAGKTVYFTATATNKTGRAVNGVLAIGIYDANGNLVKYAFANKAFADAGVNTFSATFKVEEDQTAKAFVNGTDSTVTFQ